MNGPQRLHTVAGAEVPELTSKHHASLSHPTR